MRRCLRCAIRSMGVETYSTGYTTGSALSFNTRAHTGSVFDRFAIGTTHPCWYDTQDRRTVVLALAQQRERGRIPQPYRAVGARGGEQLTVRGQSQGCDGAVVGILPASQAQGFAVQNK